MKIYLLVFSIFIFANFAYAKELTFPQFSEANLTAFCTNNGSYCYSTSTCNITIVKDGLTIANNVRMTNQVTYQNLTLNKTQTAFLGNYDYIITCNDNSLNGFTTGTFLVTPTGKLIREGEDTIAFGIVAITTVLSIIIFIFALTLKPSLIKLFSLAMAVIFFMAGIIFTGSIAQNYITNNSALVLGFERFYFLLTVLLIGLTTIGLVFAFISVAKFLKSQGRYVEE